MRHDTPTPAEMPIDVESDAYRAYHARVIAAIRDRLFARWPPKNDRQRAMLEQNVTFFDTQCTYDEHFAEQLDPEEFADDEIDAAI